MSNSSPLPLPLPPRRRTSTKLRADASTFVPHAVSPISKMDSYLQTNSCPTLPVSQHKKLNKNNNRNRRRHRRQYYDQEPKQRQSEGDHHQQQQQHHGQHGNDNTQKQNFTKTTKKELSSIGGIHSTYENQNSNQLAQKPSKGRSRPKQRKKKKKKTTTTMTNKTKVDDSNAEYTPSSGSSVDFTLLQKESVFPSLTTGLVTKNATTTTTTPTTTTAAAASSIRHGSVWDNIDKESSRRLVKEAPLSHLNKERQPQQKQQQQQDEFFQQGLQKLSFNGGKMSATNQRRKLKLNNQYEEWSHDQNEKEDNVKKEKKDEDIQNDNHDKLDIKKETINLKEECCKFKIIQKEDGNVRRRTWNMTKLRDKWWDALAIRNTRTRMMKELNRTVALIRVDSWTDTNHTTTLSLEDKDRAGNDLVGEKVTSRGTALPSAVNLSPLEEIMSKSSISAIHPSTSSTDEIVNRIFLENDATAFEELICRLYESMDTLALDSLLLDLVERSIEQDRPLLLQIILVRLNNNNTARSSSESSKKVVKALISSIRLGSEHCVSVFLTKWDDTMGLLTLRDEHGNSPLHHSCRRHSPLVIFGLILKKIAGESKSKKRQQQISKALMLKNFNGQTALHVACEEGRVDIVQELLVMCSTALLAKLLAIEDKVFQTPLLAAVGANASDVVLLLIMWRGNQNLILVQTPQSPGKQKGPPCPMVWASKNGNLDMIELLLQFSDPSGKEYRLTDSLAALITSEADSAVKATGCELLVKNGANPFQEVDESNGETSISLAANGAVRMVLSALIAAGIDRVNNTQQARRKDPKLNQQPESFFYAIECKENFEKERALSQTLVASMFLGWSEVPTPALDPPHLSAAVTLLLSGVKMKGKDIARLQLSLTENRLKMTSLFMKEPNSSCFVASYCHPTTNMNTSTVQDFDRSSLSRDSLILLRMNWFQEELLGKKCHCGWLSDAKNMLLTQNCKSDDEVVLETSDGQFFLAHASILSGKSEKLASALRFNTMKGPNMSKTNSSHQTTLKLAISSKICSWMLQHIYHGSIICGWSNNCQQDFKDFLDTMIVAEEFLCFSLLQECEMRLLSHDPYACFCWSCAKSVRCRQIAPLSGWAECLYFVDGPSLFLQGENVFDVLAIVEHLEALIVDYSIQEVGRPITWLQCLNPNKLWSSPSSDTEIWCTHAAFSALRRSTILTILSNFPQVVQSESFVESVDWSEADNIEKNGNHTDCESIPWKTIDTATNKHDVVLQHQILLLQLCLDELASGVIPPSYKTYQSGSTICKKSIS